MKKSFFLILFCLFCNFSYAQKKVIINGGEENIYPLDISAEDNTAALLPLKDLFSSRRIIGLGEATHGTKEFFQLRIALLKFLVTQCDYKSVIFEAPFGSMLLIDDYTAGGSGDIDSLLKQTGYWAFYTAEMKNFFNWVKDFNTGKPSVNKVRIFGMDMQTMLDPILYLDKKVQALPAAVRSGFELATRTVLKNDGGIKRSGKQLPSDTTARQIAGSIPLLQTWLDANRATIEGTYPGNSALWQLCIQNLRYSIALPEEDEFFRDSCMAANVIALSSFTGHRSALWAHNQHIARYDSAVNYASAQKPAGEKLQQIFKDQYYPIGFLFDQGSFLAIERKKRGKDFYYPNFKVFRFMPNKGSVLAATLSGLTGSPFFVDLSKSANPTWKKFHPFYTVGSIYYKNASRIFYLTPGSIFSALVFVPVTTPIVELDDYFNPTKD